MLSLFNISPQVVMTATMGKLCSSDDIILKVIVSIVALSGRNALYGKHILVNQEMVA